MHANREVSHHGTPGSELVLGRISPGKGLCAKVKRWMESPTVAWVTKREHQSEVELAHLFLMPDVAHMTLDEFREAGFTLGDLIGYAERNIHDLTEEFLPSLPVSDMRFVALVHNEYETFGTFCVSVLVGHRDLFEKYIMRITDPFICTELVTAEAREHARKVFMRNDGND